METVRAKGPGQGRLVEGGLPPHWPKPAGLLVRHLSWCRRGSKGLGPKERWDGSDL